MPELPEVETIRRQAERKLVGCRIKNVISLKEKIFIGDKRLIIGQKFTKIKRIGKYLLLYLEDGVGIVVHLKMTGRLVLDEIFYETALHTRVIIELESGEKLYYWDTRMFGYVKVEQKIEEYEWGLREKIGKEVWDYSAFDLHNKLQKTRRPIKEAILDQKLIGGVGNIYANDGLWDAKIHPKQAAKTLSVDDVNRLLLSLRKVLERGLELGGASDNTFRDFEGGRGGYQEEFLVYGRTNKPCLRCGKLLDRIVVGGRGTWVCSVCQGKANE